MDLEDFLVSVPFEIRENINRENKFSIGGHIKFDIDEEINENSIVLISLPQEHTLEIEEDSDFFYSKVREQFYQLAYSNWKRSIYDLGTILPGETFEDTCFALHNIVSQFSERKITVVFIGGTQALSYIIYKGIKKKYINVATIDFKLDMDASVQKLNSRNFITHMILDEEQKLLEYVNIGSQAPYNATEEFDILEQLNFENVRLGKVTESISIAEPLLREMDLVSVDLGVLQRSSFSSALVKTPNGLNEREICGIMRYCGLSESLKKIHISNGLIDTEEDAFLVSEMLWYLIDAKNNQKSDVDLETYRVLFDDQEIVFFKSKNSERWWIQVFVDDALKKIPCNESDYLNTLKGDLPDKWLKFFKKFY
ncbi:arginase family protein [Weeksellaceae bacterium TAE3-ERU29]|nr:arginase family protein [Weeksellaceae bacterium TAE3-ERU29]